MRVPKSLDELIVFITGGEATPSDIGGISAVTMAFIVCLLEMGLGKTRGGREGAHRMFLNQ